MSADRPLRLFCALDVPADVCDAVAEWWEEQPPAAELRRVPAERLHVTVTFFGALPPSRLTALQERLSRAAARHGPFSLHLAGGGRFDGRVLWARLAGDVDGVRSLARATSAAGRRVGLELEGRRFRPHLTLARATHPVDLVPWVDRVQALRSPAWPAERLALVSSTLGPQGSTYTTLQSWPLGARSAHRGGHDDDGEEHDQCQGDDPAPQPWGHQA